MQTSIDLAFGDGSYIFALPIKQIIAMEAKAGPIDAVKYRLMNGGWSIQDITETIRHGLIGGGKGMVSGVESEVSALKANLLVDTYIDGRPLAEIAIIAQSIIAALYVGYEPAQDEAQKKTEQGKNRKSSTGGSSSTTAPKDSA